MDSFENLIKNCIVFDWDARNESKDWNKHKVTKIEAEQIFFNEPLLIFDSLLPHNVFAFHGKKKVLTPFGKKLYEELRDKYHSLEKSIASVCHDFGEISNSIVKLSARTEIIERIAGKINYKGRVDYIMSNHDEIIANILNGVVDVGITHSIPNSYELFSKKILKEGFCVVIPKKLMKGETTTLDQSAPVIAYRENDPILASACHMLNFKFKDLNIKRVCANYNLIRDMVDQGIGWAVVPSHIKFEKSKTIILDLKGKSIPQKDFYMIYRRETSQTKWFKVFSKNIQESL